jgi:hypothetical protein
MLRSVSRKALSWSEATTTGLVGRKARFASVRSPSSSSHSCCQGRTSRFSTTTINDPSSWQQHPQPLPAVAYVHIDDDDDYFEDDKTAASHHHASNNNNNKTAYTSSRRQEVVNRATFGGDVKIPRRNPTGATAVSDTMTTTSPLLFQNNHPATAAAAPGGYGGNNFTTTTATTTTTHSSTGHSPPSSSSSTTGSISFRKASGGSGGGGPNNGGGTGRHRCPKCGTTVTFRCDFEENTFYCASCSGWFVANNDTIMQSSSNMEGDGSSYEEFLAKNGPSQKATPGNPSTEPEILMRHVSSESSGR